MTTIVQPEFPLTVLLDSILRYESEEERVLQTLMGWPDPPPPAIHREYGCKYGRVPYPEQMAYQRIRVLYALRRRPGCPTRHVDKEVGFYSGTYLDWWVTRGKVRKEKRPGKKWVWWFPVWPPEMPAGWEGDDS